MACSSAPSSVSRAKKLSLCFPEGPSTICRMLCHFIGTLPYHGRQFFPRKTSKSPGLPLQRMNKEPAHHCMDIR